jgi:hypothetical protein
MALLAREGAIGGMPGRRVGIFHKKPGRIRAIASMLQPGFRCSLEFIDGKKTSLAAIKHSAV